MRYRGDYIHKCFNHPIMKFHADNDNEMEDFGNGNSGK